jgi:hypothetical protein
MTGKNLGRSLGRNIVALTRMLQSLTGLLTVVEDSHQLWLKKV